MPITAITIENFKGIKGPIKVELKPITLLFGPNSSGKSTIIQALHYAREIFERENVSPDRTLLGGDSIDLGGFETLVHKHDKSLPITLRFDLDLKNEDLPRYLEGYEDLPQTQWEESELWQISSRVQNAWVEISVAWSEMRNCPLLKKYSVGVNGKILAIIQTSDDGRQIFIPFINPIHEVFLEGITQKKASKIFRNILTDTNVSEGDEEKLGAFFPLFLSVLDISEEEIPGLTKPVGIARQKSALPDWGKPLEIDRSFFSEKVDFEKEGNFVQTLSSLIVGPGELVRDALRKFCYLGPLRVVPPRNFEPARTPDESRWSKGMAAWDILFNENKHFLDKVNDWLSGKGRLNSGYRVIVKEFKELDVNDPVVISLMQGTILDEETMVPQHVLSLPTRRRLLLWEEANDIEVQPLDIGVGISQVLPVIVAGLSAKNGFTAIEQPELHIHPALQVALGDLFIEQIKEYPDVTFLLETHSEHIMLRLLRRIRETGEGELPPDAPELTPELLSIYFTEQGENGITILPIRVDRNGDFIDRWPHGFFNERVGELY